MDTQDPRQSAFSAARFRDGIKFAMRMGIPTQVPERVTFKWPVNKTYASADVRGVPYDFSTSPASTTQTADVPISLTLPCAVEFAESRSTSGETSVGSFDTASLKLTLLDDEYTQLQHETLGLPTDLLVNGNDYKIDYYAPPLGLFDVSVYQIYASARDES